MIKKMVVRTAYIDLHKYRPNGRSFRFLFLLKLPFEKYETVLLVNCILLGIRLTILSVAILSCRIQLYTTSRRLHVERASPTQWITEIERSRLHTDITPTNWFTHNSLMHAPFGLAMVLTPWIYYTDHNIWLIDHRSVPQWEPACTCTIYQCRWMAYKYNINGNNVFLCSNSTHATGRNIFEYQI